MTKNILGNVKILFYLYLMIWPDVVQLTGPVIFLEILLPVPPGTQCTTDAV